MFRRNYLSFFFIASLVLTIASASLAQTAPTIGKVEMQNADGTVVPVEGALVEVYRIDVKGSLPAAKTRKNGEFSFVGMLPGGTYVLSASAPGAAPNLFPNVQAGQANIVITLTPGDGGKYSEAQAILAAGGTTEAAADLTPEQKKALAEVAAERKRVEEKNKSIASKNQIFEKALTEGSEAFTAKNYDLAIAKFKEGYDADPTYAGSVPTFLNNIGGSYREKARVSYEKGRGLTDANEKIANNQLVKKELVESARAYQKLHEFLKTAPAGQVTDTNRLNAVSGARNTFRIAALVDRVDPELATIAEAMIPEYLAVETDAAKKLEAEVILADLYRLSDQRPKAITAYKKVLDTSPDNLDALVNGGIMLVTESAEQNNDKALAQEGANMLQKFVSSAPDTHKMKADAQMFLDLLKQQDIVPVKKAPAKKGRG